MAYNKQLAERIRTHLSTDKKVEEKAMMGGLTFMVDGKMCIGVVKDELMARIDPEQNDEALAKPHARPMDFTGRPMKGYVFVNKDGWQDDNQLNAWLIMALEFNDKAQAAKKRKK